MSKEINKFDNPAQPIEKELHKVLMLDKEWEPENETAVKNFLSGRYDIQSEPIQDHLIEVLKHDIDADRKDRLKNPGKYTDEFVEDEHKNGSGGRYGEVILSLEENAEKYKSTLDALKLIASNTVFGSPEKKQENIERVIEAIKNYPDAIVCVETRHTVGDSIDLLKQFIDNFDSTTARIKKFQEAKGSGTQKVLAELTEKINDLVDNLPEHVNDAISHHKDLVNELYNIRNVSAEDDGLIDNVTSEELQQARSNIGTEHSTFSESIKEILDLQR